MKKKVAPKKAGLIKRYWWLGLLAGLVVVIAIAGKISGGIKEDRFCQTSHETKLQKPADLKTAKDWLLMADYNYETGRCQEAISDLNMAIGINDQYAEAYNNRGFIKRKLGLVKESIADFDKAIELRPNYPHALMNRGDAYRQLDDKSEALKNYAMVVKLGKEAIKSEAVCGRREMLLHNNFLKAMWNAWTRHDDDGCWKMYFEK